MINLDSSLAESIAKAIKKKTLWQKTTKILFVSFKS